MKRLSETVLVAGQIDPGDVSAIAEAGVKLIVNNRPDGEEPGQPPGAEIAAEAAAAGLAYLDLPVAGHIAADQVEALAASLDRAEGETLLFCRSGTRSTWLWALAEARRGAGAETLVAQAARAGYDIRPLLPRLKAVET